MEYQTEEGLQSRTLNRFWRGLDDTILDMELKIKFQDEKIREMQKQIAEDLNRRVQEGNAMVANALMACISEPKVTDASTAIVLGRIRNMQTIEEVHEYVNKIIEGNATGKEADTGV